MKHMSFACALLFLAMTVSGQAPKLSVEISSDTLLLGNYFELKFTIENAPSAAFEAPDLSDFFIVGGPNTSTSMSIINGEVSQSASYKYYLEPKEIGVFTIKPAYLTVDGATIETPPIDLIVSPNPDGIIKPPNRPAKRFDQLFAVPAPIESDTLPKKKRKKF